MAIWADAASGNLQMCWRNGGVPQTTKDKPPACKPARQYIFSQGQPSLPFSKTESKAAMTVQQSILIHIML